MLPSEVSDNLNVYPIIDGSTVGCGIGVGAWVGATTTVGSGAGCVGAGSGVGCAGAWVGSAVGCGLDSGGLVG